MASLFDQRERKLIEDLISLKFRKDFTNKNVYWREKLGPLEMRKFLKYVKTFENLTGRRVFWSNIGNMIEINIRPNEKPESVMDRKRIDKIEYNKEPDEIDRIINKWMVKKVRK